MLADKLLDMNVFELRYFSLAIKEKMLKTSGINPMKMNLDWPSVKRDGKYKSVISDLSNKEGLSQSLLISKNLIALYLYRHWFMATSQPQLVQTAGNDG